MLPRSQISGIAYTYKADTNESTRNMEVRIVAVLAQCDNDQQSGTVLEVRLDQRRDFCDR